MIKSSIYIDADACPVKAEAAQIATRHQLRLVIVSNGGIRPSTNPLVQLVIVAVVLLMIVVVLIILAIIAMIVVDMITVAVRIAAMLATTVVNMVAAFVLIVFELTALLQRGSVRLTSTIPGSGVERPRWAEPQSRRRPGLIRAHCRLAVLH